MQRTQCYQKIKPQDKQELIKNRQLYPAIYLATKDMDITIIYGRIPGEKTEKMKKCKFD